MPSVFHPIPAALAHAHCVTSVDECAQVLRTCGVAVLPTDTVLGLAVSVEACTQGPQALYRIKKRPSDKPVAWLVDDVSVLDIYGVHVPNYVFDLAEAFWPGGLTLVVRASELVPQAFRSPSNTLALRMPACSTTQAVIRAVGAPLATTSANTSGCPAPSSLAELEEEIACAADAVLIIDEPAGGVSSTVIDCTHDVAQILRQGALSAHALAQVLGTDV